jgi:4-oxalocrotonate tautomerase
MASDIALGLIVAALAGRGPIHARETRTGRVPVARLLDEAVENPALEPSPGGRLITRSVTRRAGGLRRIGPSTTKERHMPLINVKVIEGVFTPEQKSQIAERLTDAMVSVEGENMRGVTWCVIDEVKSGDWAIGGQSLTTEAVHSLAAGQPA